MDIQLIVATVVNTFSWKHALGWVANMLGKSGAPGDLVRVGYRNTPRESVGIIIESCGWEE